MKLWKESRGSQVCRVIICSVLLEEVGDGSSGDTAAATSVLLVDDTRLPVIVALVVVVEEEEVVAVVVVVMLSYCATCLFPFLNGTEPLSRSSPTVRI